MIDPENIFKFQQQNPSHLSEGNFPVLTWYVPKDFPYFEGHFPQNPILPALAILDGSLEALKFLQKGNNFFIKKVKTGKFLNIISPGILIEIHILKKIEQEWELQWKSSDKTDQKIFAHLKLSLNHLEPRVSSPTSL